MISTLNNQRNDAMKSSNKAHFGSSVFTNISWRRLLSASFGGNFNSDLASFILRNFLATAKISTLLGVLCMKQRSILQTGIFSY